jgi:hypothetical protein
MEKHGTWLKCEQADGEGPVYIQARHIVSVSAIDDVSIRLWTVEQTAIAYHIKGTLAEFDAVVLGVGESRKVKRPRPPNPAEDNCPHCGGEGYPSDPCDICGGGH